MNFFPEIEVTAHQADVIARGLFAVARAEEGIHPREAALITSFYAETSGGLPSDLVALERAPDIQPEALATALAGPTARLFLKTCILLAWVDGNLAPSERDVIDGFARALGVGADELSQIEVNVKEYLLAHLSRLANVDAAAQVAKKLGI